MIKRLKQILKLVNMELKTNKDNDTFRSLLIIKAEIEDLLNGNNKR